MHESNGESPKCDILWLYNALCKYCSSYSLLVDYEIPCCILITFCYYAQYSAPLFYKMCYLKFELCVTNSVAPAEPAGSLTYSQNLVTVISEAVVNNSQHIQFLRWIVVKPRPTPKLEGHPLSAVRDCLFNTFAATLHISGRHLLYPQPEDAPCRGDLTRVRPFKPAYCWFALKVKLHKVQNHQRAHSEEFRKTDSSLLVRSFSLISR
jgi:hypothetical protein